MKKSRRSQQEKGTGNPERRGEPRRSLSGAMLLSYEGPEPVEIAGELLDFGHEGFRLEHFHAMLRVGQIVRFQHVMIEGKAEVVWTRQYPDRVESGFRILQEPH